MSDLIDTIKAIEWNELIVTWGAKLLIALVIFLVGRWLAKLLGRLVDNLVRRTGMDIMLARFLSKLTTIVVTIMAIIAAVDQLGVKTTSLIAVLGAAGLAVGLALQGSLSNFAASVMLIVFKPFKIGDYVDVGGASGTVDEIGMFNTRLISINNQTIVVPNSNIINSNIINYTHYPTRRIDEVIGISYNDSPESARQIILDLVSNDERYLSDPVPLVWIKGFGDSSIDLYVRVWTRTEDFWQARSDLLEHIKQKFDASGIEIPFPQRDLHLFDNRNKSS